MADRALNVAGTVLAVLLPLVVGLAAALLVRGPGPAVASVLVLWACWLVGLAVVGAIAFRPVRAPQISHHTKQTIRGR